jgi:hypothetical protein
MLFISILKTPYAQILTVFSTERTILEFRFLAHVDYQVLETFLF